MSLLCWIFSNRGCSEIYHMPLVDYKNHKEGMPYELKFPFRPPNSNTKWPRTSSSPQTRGTGGTLIKAPPPDFTNSAAMPRSVSSDGRPINPKRLQIKASIRHVIKNTDSYVCQWFEASWHPYGFSQIFPRKWQLCSGLLRCNGSHTAQHKLPRQLHWHHEFQPLEAKVNAWWVRSLLNFPLLFTLKKCTVSKI